MSTAIERIEIGVSDLRVGQGKLSVQVEDLGEGLKRVETDVIRRDNRCHEDHKDLSEKVARLEGKPRSIVGQAEKVRALTKLYYAAAALLTALAGAGGLVALQKAMT